MNKHTTIYAIFLAFALVISCTTLKKGTESEHRHGKARLRKSNGCINGIRRMRVHAGARIGQEKT